MDTLLEKDLRDLIREVRSVIRALSQTLIRIEDLLEKKPKVVVKKKRR
jgi:signal transduction histidine kinase